ncbi:MAG: hypothetical protein N2B60_02020 [Psychrobacter sp.]
MSKSKSIPKLISRFEIGFDNETKVEIDALKNKLDEVTRALSAKNNSHGDGLLAAIQAEAANDAPQPEFKCLGQWVFEGVDDKYQSAAMDKDGKVYIYECALNDLNKNTDNGHCYWWPSVGVGAIYVCTMSDGSNWEHYAIQRETVNDVDYLSYEAPKTHGMPTFIGIDEYDSLSECVPHIDDAIDQSDWLSESAPQITQADMQLIFINNLSAVLIQRMHSMNRFSHDDYTIGGDKLMPWDIVIGQSYSKPLFGIVFAQQHSSREHLNKVDAVLLEPKGSHGMIAGLANIYFDKNDTYRTITEAELPTFRAALEACYA